jgi:hypothetical protein
VEAEAGAVIVLCPRSSVVSAQQLRRLGDAPGLVAGEQPLCKRLRKWQIFRAWDEAQNSYAESDCNLRDATGRLALFINGHRSIRGGQGQLALLACLLDNLGRAVPYKRLFTVIGRKSDNGYNRHLLRQYIRCSG